MHSGKIVESGTHEDLLQNHALYWSLYSGKSSFSPSPDTEARRG
jgi:ABC-type multidrug transport system fused ATPase/permease subunit